MFWCKLKKTCFLQNFASNFLLSLAFSKKTSKMTISTSVWSAQHPNSGWNIQQMPFFPYQCLGLFYFLWHLVPYSGSIFKNLFFFVSVLLSFLLFPVLFLYLLSNFCPCLWCLLIFRVNICHFHTSTFHFIYFCHYLFYWEHFKFVE